MFKLLGVTWNEKRNLNIKQICEKLCMKCVNEKCELLKAYKIAVKIQVQNGHFTLSKEQSCRYCEISIKVYICLCWLNMLFMGNVHPAIMKQ